MEQYMITIGREFGSGGHKVGQILSQKLNMAYYDNELITLAAQRGKNVSPNLTRENTTPIFTKSIMTVMKT